MPETITIGCPHCGELIDLTAKPAAAPTAADAVTPEWLQEAWNRYKAPAQVASRKLTPSLRTQARARAREFPRREDWVAMIKLVAASKFMRGEERSRDGRVFVADFAYLLRPATASRAYDKLQQPTTAPASAGHAQRETRDRNVDHVTGGVLAGPEAVS